VPAIWDDCISRDWPGITDKPAFCAWLTHRETGKWPTEKNLNPESFSLSLPVAKFDEQQGVVTGWAALSTANDKPLIDYHDELCLVEELEKAAHKLMLTGGANKAGEMHASRVGDIVESMVLSKEKAAALGYAPIQGRPETEGWAVSMKISDEGARDRARNGSRPELSIHGSAKKIPIGKRGDKVIKALVDIDVDEISLVDRGASGNDDAQPKIVIAKRLEGEPDIKGLVERFVEQVKKVFGGPGPHPSADGSHGPPVGVPRPGRGPTGPEGPRPTAEGTSKMNLDEILAKLTEEERAVVLAAIEAAKPAAPPPPAEPVVAAADEGKKPSEEEMAKILANLPEPVRKQLEEADKAKTETQELRKRLDEIEERETVAKFRSKAEELPFLAGKKTDEIAKLLRAASEKMKPAEYQEIEKLLVDANRMVKESPIFLNSGSRGNDAETTARGQIEALAKKLRETDAKLTKEQAVSKALNENPELYSQYKAELRGEA